MQVVTKMVAVEEEASTTSPRVGPVESRSQEVTITIHVISVIHDCLSGLLLRTWEATCYDIWLYVFKARLVTRGRYSDPADNPSRKKDVGS